MSKTKRSPTPPRASAAYPPYRFRQILSARGDYRVALRQLIEEEKAYVRGQVFISGLKKRIGAVSARR